jgi:hypothetical protein
LWLSFLGIIILLVLTLYGRILYHIICQQYLSVAHFDKQQEQFKHQVSSFSYYGGNGDWFETDEKDKNESKEANKATYQASQRKYQRYDGGEELLDMKHYYLSSEK